MMNQNDYFGPMTDEQKENVSYHLDNQIRDAALWFGGWDKLRERIKMLEDNEAEAAFERSQNKQ